MPVRSLYDFVRCDVRPRLVLRSVHWLMPSALGMVPHPKQCELLAAGRGLRRQNIDNAQRMWDRDHTFGEAPYGTWSLRKTGF